MSGSFTNRGTLDIADGRIIACFGKKRSGKSVLGKLLYESFPGDKLVIDVAGDDGPEGDFHLSGRVGELPPEWDPTWVRTNEDGKPRPVSVRYVPDPGSPTYAEDIDHVIGLVLRHGMRLRKEGKQSTACLLIHEIGRVAPANQTRANMKRLLEHNRHYGVTLIMCGPRPATIDPLVIQQADIVYTFELMNLDDRERLAKNMGWDVQAFSTAVMSLGPHEYIRFDANEMKPARGKPDRRLVHLPALPLSAVRRVS